MLYLVLQCLATCLQLDVYLKLRK